jgi:hypothetical protein
MKKSSIEFQISQLRQAKVIHDLHAITVMVFSFFAILFLPRLLFTYYYANMALTEEPALMKHIPLIFFVIGTAVFLYAMVTNALRALKIAKLEKQLATASSMDSCCMDCDNCSCDEHGNCNCGCEVPVGPVTSMASTNMMAAKMSSLNKKKKPARRK